jgi:hypothetical protein
MSETTHSPNLMHNWLAAVLHDGGQAARRELHIAHVLGQTTGVFHVRLVDGSLHRVSIEPVPEPLLALREESRP